MPFLLNFFASLFLTTAMMQSNLVFLHYAQEFSEYEAESINCFTVKSHF